MSEAVVFFPIEDFRAGLAEGQESEAEMPVKGVAVSQLVPERRLKFSEAAWNELTSAAKVDICIGTSHEAVWIDADSVVGLASLNRSEDNRALISGELDPSDDRSKRIYPRLQEDSPYFGHFSQSIGGVMKDVKRLPEGSEAEFEIGGWSWNHLLLCRKDSAVHKDASVEAGFAERLYMAAVACTGGSCEVETESEEEAPTDEEMVGLAEDMDGFLFGTEDEEAFTVEEAESAVGALFAILNKLDLAAVSTKPWGPIVKNRKNFKPSQFLYVGDSNKKSTWKFPVREISGALNINGVYAAVRRLATTTDEVKKVVASKLRSIYRNILHKPLPSALKTAVASEESMDKSDSVTKLLSVAQLLLSAEEAAEEEATAEAESETASEDPVEETPAEPAPDPVEEEPSLKDQLAKTQSELAELRKKIGLAEAGGTEDPAPDGDETPSEETSSAEEPSPDGESEDPPTDPAVDEDAVTMAAVKQLIDQGFEELLEKLDSKGETQVKVKIHEDAQDGEQKPIGIFSGQLSPFAEV